MFRLALRRLLGTSRIAVNSSKNLPKHSYFYLFREFSSEIKDNNVQSRVPLGNVNTSGEPARMGIQFRCKVCDHTLQKTFTRQSYEHGVVIIRCDSCSNLHLIADNLGWFKDLTQNGKFKNIAQMLQGKGETVHRVTVAPTDDPSVLKETDSTEKLKVNDDKISSS